MRTTLRAILLAILVLAPLEALAFKVNPPLVIEAGTGNVDLDETATLGNTCANVSGTVAVANGGTGQVTATAAFNALDPLTTKGDLIVHNGTDSIRVGVGANGLFLKANSAQASGVEWGTGPSAVYPSLDFLSETSVDLNAETRYMGLGGRLSATENQVAASISAATLGNLRCVPSATVGGTSLVVTLGVGACTGALDYTSKPTVTPATANTAVVDATTAAVTAGQCVALKMVATGNTNDVFVNCTIEKSANS